MSTEIPAEVKISQGSKFRVRRLLEKWPLLIWIVMLVLVVFMYNQRGTFSRVNGVVTASSESVAAAERGDILIVHVMEGQDVKKGQPMVTLDSKMLQMEIDELQEKLNIDRLERRLEFQDNLSVARDRLLAVQENQDQDQGALEAAEETVASLEKRLENNRATVAQVEEAKAKRNALRRRVQSYEARIEQAKTDVEDAEELLERLAEVDGSGNAGEDPKALLVLRRRFADKTLLAPADGTIQRVLKLRGVAQAGEPIITMLLKGNKEDDTAPPPKMVRGFIPQQENPEQIHPGDAVWIAVNGRKQTAFSAKVHSVAPDLTTLATQGTVGNGAVMRGRQFLAELPGDLHHLIPGTEVHIYREEPGRFDFWSFGKTPVKAAGN